MQIGYAVNMPKPIQYLFIDGGYLRGYLEDLSATIFNDYSIELDFTSLSRGFEKTFYYDCCPPQKKAERKAEYEKRLENQKQFFNSLKELNGYHVYEGTISGEGKKARQKQVDIMIAVHMLSHTIRGNMAKTTLLAGDLDYKPLIDALIQEGMHVTLWCERRSTSQNLVYSADVRRDLNLWEIWGNTSNKFKKRFPIPQRASHGTRKSKNLRPIQTGKSKNDSRFELYYNPSEKHFRIIFNDPVNDDHFIHIDYPDRDILERCLKEEGIEIKWDKQFIKFI